MYLNNDPLQPSWRQFARRMLLSACPRSLLIADGPADKGLVWLTFDDGPHPEHTPRLLEALHTCQIKASFFLIGAHAQQYPDLVREMVKQGHAIGYHTHDHILPFAMSASDFSEDLRRGRKLLHTLAGRETAIFRPPRGKLTRSMLFRLWRDRQKVVLWNTDPKDYAMTSSEELRCWFADHPLASGDIVLLHEKHSFTAAILPELVERTRSANLDFASLDHPAIALT
ncbi:MAG: polysaccharide deacetylase family protein [Planctomycetota bacterium]